MGPVIFSLALFGRYNWHRFHYVHFCIICTFTIPVRVMLAESEDGLLLDTVQVYSPPVVTVRVCVYCAVSGSFNTVSFSFSDSDGVSGPSDSGSRSSSGDTGEGHLVRIKCHFVS